MAEPTSLSWVARFVALAYLISWTLWAPLVMNDQLAIGPVLGVLGAFGPALAAIVVTHRRFGTIEPLRAQLRFRRSRWHWYLAGVALPVVAVGTTALLVRVLGVGGPSPVPGWEAFPAVLAFSVILGGGQEEPGWRGVAQPWLEERLRPFPAALLVGAAWATWHAPLFLMEGSTQRSLGLDPVVYALSVPALSVLVAWVHRASGGSLIVAALFHGALNAATVVGYPFGELRTQALATAVVWVVALILRSSQIWNRHLPTGTFEGAGSENDPLYGYG